MRTLGIIAEYDPFHNGHRFHIEAARAAAGADAVLILMSGHAVQRGGFPIADKWLRAAAALANGADLVCELPYCYAGQTAEIFAGGAVALLDAAGCDAISFGTEANHPEDLMTLARLLSEEPANYRQSLKESLKQGFSFPAARQKAAAGILGEEIASLLHLPNAALGIEYLKACIRINSPMEIVPVLRKGAGHDALSCDTVFPSAAGIRETLLSQNTSALEDALPYDHTVFDPFLIKKRHQALSQTVLFKLLTSSRESLLTLPDVTEGLDAALMNSIQKHTDLDSIIESTASKRIPKSRIRRILMHLCLNYTQTDFNTLSLPKQPHYLRVLGCNDTGRKLLRTIQKKETLPILTNLHSNQVRLNKTAQQSLNFDCRVTDLYYLLGGEPHHIHLDYRKHPVILQ